MTVNNHTNLFGRRDLLRLGSLGSLGLTLDKVLRAAPALGRREVKKQALPA